MSTSFEPNRHSASANNVLNRELKKLKTENCKFKKELAGLRDCVKKTKMTKESEAKNEVNKAKKTFKKVFFII